MSVVVEPSAGPADVAADDPCSGYTDDVPECYGCVGIDEETAADSGWHAPE